MNKQSPSTFVRFNEERDIDDYRPISDDRERRTPCLLDAFCTIAAETSCKLEEEGTTK